VKSDGNRLFGIAKNLGSFSNGLVHRDAAAKGRTVSGATGRGARGFRNARSLSTKWMNYWARRTKRDAPVPDRQAGCAACLKRPPNSRGRNRRRSRR
jgi:hypothetical protein